MKLLKLKLTNFKKFENKEFEFKDENYIEGKNGEGKSTIRDAVFFCFYNRTSDGSLTDSSKYILDGKIKCAVELTFETNGETYIISRERTEKQTRIKLLDNSQSEDDSVITQRELDSLVPDYEAFQAVFNVGYFMKLEDKEKREFLLRLTPDIDRNKLFNNLGGTDSDLFTFNLDLTNIESSHKNLLKIRREQQEKLDNNNAIIADSKEIIVPKSTILKPDLDSAEKEKIEADKSAIEWNSYNQAISRITTQEKTNQEVKKKIALIKIKDLPKPSLDKLNQLKEEQINVGKIHHIPEDRCPTCLQEINSDHKNKVASVNDRIIKRIEKLIAATEKERRFLDDAQKLYEENERAKKEIEILKASIREIPEVKEPESLKEFDLEKYAKLKEQSTAYLSEQNTIKLLTNQETERKEKISKLNEENKTLISTINGLNKLIRIFSQEGIPAKEMELKLQPIVDKFRELLPNAEIKLVELLKNELGFKEVFNVVVDGRYYNKLSTGEKIQTDVAISQIIDSMLKEPISVLFLDNAESLSELISIKPQFFIAIVNQNNLTLK
jgi:DNA repair exonuclease SbcCD ATPase subunit